MGLMVCRWVAGIATGKSVHAEQLDGLVGGEAAWEGGGLCVAFLSRKLYNACTR